MMKRVQGDTAVRFYLRVAAQVGNKRVGGLMNADGKQSRRQGKQKLIEKISQISIQERFLLKLLLNPASP